MNPRHLPLLALLALGALAGGSVSCARPGSVFTGGTDTLYIGVAAARANSAYFDGTQLAIDRLNALRPPGAHPLGLRLPPDSQPSQVAVAVRFRDDPTVIGVVGHTGSAQTMEAAPIYGDVADGGRNGIVAITPTATNPNVTRISNWVFRVCPTDDDAARALARFAADSVRAYRVAIIYRNDLFGRGFTRTILPELRLGGISVAERDPYLAGITEYDAYARRIAVENVDAVIVAGGGIDAADMLRALRHAGVHPAILGSDDVANIADTSADGRRQPPDFRNVRYTAFYDPARAVSPEERAFVEAYRKRFGQMPTHSAALSYDAATIIGLAAFAVGGDRHAIRDWVAGIGRGAPPQHGITGDIRFGEHGDAVGKQVLIAKVTP